MARARSSASLISSVIAVALVTACAGDPDGGEGGIDQPPGWDDALRLTELADENPDPRVVEVRLEARAKVFDFGMPGKPTLYTYDGALPGPLLRARRGDRVIVHFTNRLDQPTSIHWHGLRVDNAMDGVPDHHRPPIAAGAGFTYDFVVPDAGLYWYHPHVDSAAQVGRGLYGAILVEDAEEPAPPGEELVLVLSDLSVAEDGSLLPPDSGGDIATVFGREGSLVLVNGRRRPTATVRAGAPIRLRIVNAARSRYFQLALAGHTFRVLGRDGGLQEWAEDVERPVIVPGARLDAVIVPRGAPGEELVLRWIPYDRGYGSTELRDPVDLLVLRVADLAAAPESALPAVGSPLRAIEPLDLAGAEPVVLRFTHSEHGGKTILGFDSVPFDQSVPIAARVGRTQTWTIENTTHWSHPFHLHGFFFQPIDAQGAPLHPAAWRDTIDVPASETLRMAVRYDDRPGMWMFHCHILDHADAGMMGMIHVEPR